MRISALRLSTAKMPEWLSEYYIIVKRALMNKQAFRFV